MKKTLIIVAIVVALAAVVIIKRKSSNDAQAVNVEALETRDIRSSILATGKLSHEEEVKLSTEVIGRVSALYVKEGDVVTVGQLVAQIDLLEEKYKERF